MGLQHPSPRAADRRPRPGRRHTRGDSRPAGTSAKHINPLGCPPKGGSGYKALNRTKRERKARTTQPRPPEGNLRRGEIVRMPG
jgi:hypothetical protein